MEFENSLPTRSPEDRLYPFSVFRRDSRPEHPIRAVPKSQIYHPIRAVPKSQIHRKNSPSDMPSTRSRTRSPMRRLAEAFSDLIIQQIEKPKAAPSTSASPVANQAQMYHVAPYAKMYQNSMSKYEFPTEDQGWEYHYNRWWKWYGGSDGDWFTQWIVYNNGQAAAFEWWPWTDM